MDEAIEAALEQYAFMFGERLDEMSKQDQDAMREELYALFRLGAPYLKREALYEYADNMEKEAYEWTAIEVAEDIRTWADGEYGEDT